MHQSRLPIIALAILGNLITLGSSGHSQDLPLPAPATAAEKMDVQETLLPAEILSNASQPIFSDTPDQPAAAADVATLEKQLERAKRYSNAGMRLVRIGAIAKVEGETRELKVVRLTWDLDTARAKKSEEEWTRAKASHEAKEISDEAFQEVTKKHEALVQAAKASEIQWKNAELAAAELNLKRRQLLLASGIGKRADIDRARAKVEALKKPKSE